MRGANVTAYHYARDCPPLGLFRVAYHTQLGVAIREFYPCWYVNKVHPTGLLIYHGQDLLGIALRPQSISGPLPYVQVCRGFIGEMSPRDVSLLLRRGITRKALRALMGFVLRMVDANHFRHNLPDFPVTPEFRTLISAGEYAFLSWLHPVPNISLPPSWQSDAPPRLVQWPHAAIIRWISLHNFNWVVRNNVAGVRE